MCRGTERAGFLFAADEARVKITGGLFAKNVAVRRGGVVSDPKTLDWCYGSGGLPSSPLLLRSGHSAKRV